jgi:hypothetical protein
MDSKVSLILSDSDTCVTLERVFYAWARSQKSPILIFKNSFPSVREMHQKTMTKIGKTKHGELQCLELTFRIN